MSTTQNHKKLDTIFEALAHQHRREIVYALGLQPYTISQLATQRKLSLQAIHKHIKLLEKARLIIRKKIGKSTVLVLNRESLQTLQEWLSEYHPYWGSGSETLENYEEFVKEKVKGGENK